MYSVHFVTLQMVRLYRDPDGATVFAAHDNAIRLATSTATAAQSSQHLLDGDKSNLKKRVKELESVLVVYKVIEQFMQEFIL